MAVDPREQKNIDAINQYFKTTNLEQQRRDMATRKGGEWDPQWAQRLKNEFTRRSGEKAMGQRELAEADMRRNVEQGRSFARDLLGEEGLGRMGTDPEVQQTLERFKNVSEEGLSREEVSARRAEALGAIQGQTQGDLRRLQANLARSGVKGETAGNLLMRRQLRGAEQAADVERDLFLADEQIQRQGLADYSQRLGAVRSFDLSQAAQEKALEAQSGLAFAQMGSSERSAERAGQLAREAQAEAARLAPKPKSGLTVICTELHRQGKLDMDLLKRAYAHSKKVDPRIYSGYLTWAIPTVLKMQKSKSFSKVVETLFKPVIHRMAGSNKLVDKLCYGFFYGVSYVAFNFCPQTRRASA